MPAGIAGDEKQARYTMLEKLADYDDALMEQLISDIEPPRDRVFDDLAKELRDGHVVPLLIGSATAGHGVTRLLKALRHEAPGVAQTRARLGVEDDRPGAGAGAAHHPHRPRRQAVAGAGAARRLPRRRDGDRLARRRGAHRRPRAADGRGDSPSWPGPRRATPSPSPGSKSFATGDRFGDGKSRPSAAAIAAAPAAHPGVRDRRQGPQGRGPARRRARQAQRGGPLARLRPGPGIGRAEAVRPGRDAPARDARAARRPLRRRRRDAEALGRLSRDDPRRRSRCAAGTRSSPAATASSATSWSRSAPRDRGEGFAFAEKRARRHGAEAVFLVGRGGRARRAGRAARSAFRWSTSR